MSFMHTTALSGVDGGVAQATKAYDTTKLFAGSFQVTLAGATAPSVTCALQGSNAVPPNGAYPNQQASSGIGGAGWDVPASSWVALKDTNGTAITATLADNGTTLLRAPGTSLLTRWVRVTTTPVTNSGGALTVEVFLRDTGT